MEHTRRAAAEAKDARVVSFEMLYQRYGASIYSFLLRLTGDAPLAEDLHQATWLKLLRHQQALRADSNIRAWLFAVARNEYRSYRRWRGLDLSRLLCLHSARAIEQVPACGSESLALERGLKQLSADDREVLLLVGVEGFEPQEAAELLGISAPTLRKRLSRARSRLAATMEHDV